MSDDPVPTTENGLTYEERMQAVIADFHEYAEALERERDAAVAQRDAVRSTLEKIEAETRDCNIALYRNIDEVVNAWAREALAGLEEA